MTQYLFVYGSLRKGHAPPEIAETADKLKFVGEAFIFGKLYDLGAYRGLILDGNSKIFGEVLELPDDEKVLQRLDEYEGFDPNNQAESLFCRVKTVAFTENEELETWIYEFNRDVSELNEIET